jgi:CRISPR-associated endonuclease/helicase Cas3
VPPALPERHRLGVLPRLGEHRPRSRHITVLVYAHSVPDQSIGTWEALCDHLKDVGTLASDFAAAFGCRGIGRIAGLLHDIGKCSEDYQTYIRQPPKEGGKATGPDHSGAGAKEAAIAYPGPLGRMLAFAIAGHHAGLPDFDGLDLRLQRTVPAYDGWRAQIGALPSVAELRPANPMAKSDQDGFMQSFLVRMLYSCLVDADWLATEAFYARAHGETVERGGFTALCVLQVRLQEHMTAKQAKAPPSAVNALRAEVLAHAIGKASLPTGLFTLTVPTGGGKTLASLSFALDHAMRHGLRRIVYVIPFTSIVEQTAQVFREALHTMDDVLEHHASFDWEAAEKIADADSEGPDGVRKLRAAAENWDAPVIVTTAVQFFESLFANGRSRCRKLHNLARAVIVLDEAQTLPLNLLQPCLAAMDELCRNYGASVVLCTATQPAVRRLDGFPKGLEIPTERELAPDPPALYARLRRVNVEQAEDVTDEAIAERFAAAPQMLCIVATRAHALDLFDRIRGLPGAVHLTTLMVPRHRRAVLDGARARLAAGAPVRLVATSLIEAGVDVDFPEVWRAVAGLDSIAQAAGRCNREGRRAPGRMVVFQPAARPPPRAMAVFAEVAAGVLARHDDPLSLEAVHEYFRQLYWNRGPAAFDVVKINGQKSSILGTIKDRASRLDFPFKSIAAAFRMIDEAMASVVVPWRATSDDTQVGTLLGRIAAMERPLQADLRALQQYVVPIPRAARDAWLALGALRPVHARLGDALLTFDDDSLYDPQTGLRLDNPTYRSAEDNIT